MSGDSAYSNFEVHKGPAPKWQQWTGKAILRLSGWKIVGRPPETRKFVATCAPHTSNWDTFFWICLCRAYGLRAHWMCKGELFVGPLGALLRWTGGVPVDRGGEKNYVQQMTQIYEANDEFIIAIAVEGTRYYTEQWKSGFYHIAQAAHVPVWMVFIDYERKHVGGGPLVSLTGDIPEDMDVLREFYDDKAAKYPERKSRIRLREEDELAEAIDETVAK